MLRDVYEDEEYIRNGELAIPNVSSGRHLYYIYTTDDSCSSGYIATKSLDLAFYNEYYNYKQCDKFKGKYYCLKWVKSDITYNEWLRNVRKYEASVTEEKEVEKVDSLFDIEVDSFLTTVNYDYPNFHLIMHAYTCTLINDIEFVYHNDNELEHDNMIWLEKNDLDHLDWLAADIGIISAYKNKY